MHDTTIAAADVPATRPPPRPARPPGGRLPLLLYVLSAVTTFAAGAVGWQPEMLGLAEHLGADVVAHWPRGLAYMVAVLAVLSAHEAGHWVAARLHGIRTTLPFFIPTPILCTGTLGAVIGMEGSRADRRQLFDIALAGPVAGLVVALPLLAAGVVTGSPTEVNGFGLPLLAVWVRDAVRPDLGAATVVPNPWFMAGWVGLLVTGLNMMPVSQLDGGHICRAVFGPRGNWVARGVLGMAVAWIVATGSYDWILMVVAVILMGVDHPPIREDGRPLGPVRTILGLLSFVIPAVTFMPEPLVLP